MLRTRLILASYFLVFSVLSDQVVLGSPINLIPLPSTTHSYAGGGSNPQLSHDGDFATAWTAGAGPGNNGGYGVTITSQHLLASPGTIDSVIFRIWVHGYATGSYIRNHEGNYVVEYLVGANWLPVPGSANGFSGGDGDTSLDSGVVTRSGLNLQSVSGIRAIAHGFGNASGNEGNAGGHAYIYELQAFGIVLGDMDGNGVLNNFDIAAFESALTNPGDYLILYPGLTDYLQRGDLNRDGLFNNFDIAPFEDLLNGSLGAPVPEPESFFLMTLGMILVFGVMRKERCACTMHSADPELGHVVTSKPCGGATGWREKSGGVPTS